MFYIDSFQELIESMDIIAEQKFKSASQIYYCLVKSVSNKQCTVIFNNKQYTFPFFGGAPIPNKTYAIFLPQNNINQAFVIGEGASGGGSGIAIQPDPPTGDELVWIDTDDPGTSISLPEIDDNNVSPDDTWSSQKIRDFIYPIGSIYMSVNSTSPATIFGGTWEQIQDTFLLAAGTTYTAGATGGEAEHTLTNGELPKLSGSLGFRRAGGSYSPIHTATGSIISLDSPSAAAYTTLTLTGSAATTYHRATISFGDDKAHNNMPPYLAVYIWKRTA